jgi:hypothetical protein
MSEKPTEHPEDHEDENRLKIFADTLGDEYAADLPEEEKPKSELGIIRQVLQEFSEKYGITFQIYDGRELNYELALNHRLDDMIYTSPQSLSDEIAIAIQENTVTQEQADEIVQNLTDEDGLELYSVEKLERLLYNICQVLEVVVVDPQKFFQSDLAAQSRLLQCLQSAGNMVQSYIDAKPHRDGEYIQARDYLTTRLTAAIQRFQLTFKDYPDLIPPIIEVYSQILPAAEAVPTDLEESRGHLIAIFNKSMEVTTLSYDLARVIVDQKKLDDVLAMIADL